MAKSKIGVCKFCSQEKKLIDAHIIPKKFYLKLDGDRILLMNSRTLKYKFQQNGGYDSTILCSDCDNHILGEFDKEAYKVLFSDFSKYEFVELQPDYKIYLIDNTKFDYHKLRNFFISILWRASVSDLEQWSNINLAKYEKKAFEILNGTKEHNELFKILIYKNKYDEDVNSIVLIAKGKTSKYKKYVIQMAGYRIEVMVDSSRVSNNYKLQYGRYFLNSEYVSVIETPDVSRRINKEYNAKMFKMYEQGFVPPKPKGVE